MPLGQLGLFQKILTGKILDHRVLRLEGGSATVSQPPAPGFGLLPVMKAICAPPARIPNELISGWLEPAPRECVGTAFGCDPSREPPRLRAVSAMGIPLRRHWMANRDIVAIGTSAGGVEALIFLAKNLPARFPASILVTLHLPAHTRSVLDELLSRAGALPASFAADGEVLRKGRIYLAPAGSHLIVHGERLALGNGPRENNSRPSIDPMFRSAALCCGSRTIGIVLTGTLGDGASGLWAVKQAGGITLVQDPHEAAFPEMPQTALSYVERPHIVSRAELPHLLVKPPQHPAGEPRPI